MKKTLITFLALASVAAAGVDGNWKGTFSWGSDKPLTFNLGANSPISVSLSATMQKYAENSEATNATYKEVSTDGYTGTFSPGINVGDATNGGSWTLTFTVKNESDESLDLTGFSVDLYTYASGGGIQGEDTKRALTLTLSNDSNVVAFKETYNITHGGDKPVTGAAKNYAFDMNDSYKYLGVGESFTFDLTVTRSGTNPGTFVGLQSATFKIIPEPATATLSLLALCGLAARRRRS